jgi:multiple sugar transport system permease protein
VPSSTTTTQASGPASSGLGPDSNALARARSADEWRNPRLARNTFIWPTLLVVLLLAIFPLIASLGLALSNFQLAQGGFSIKFIGLANFQNLFFGADRNHFLGVFQTPTPVGWVIFLGATALVVVALARYLRGGRASRVGIVGRVTFGVLIVAFLWMIASTLLGSGGRPGTLTVTFIYAFVGTGLEYLIGLGLAMLTIQKLGGQRFFRVVFLLPMTITPVGIAYMFRMLTDTQGGPFAPAFSAAGMSNFALLGDPWGARIAVIIGDVWQWIPFMYIVLLAGLEGRDLETEEAGLVDGAGRWQIFRHITLPMIIPVSATVILIRLIEAFKIIDLPNVMTGGGPGTATESVTLQSFQTWRAFNLGSSAAVAYTLLIVVTVVATAYARLVLPRAHRANA